MRNKDSENIGPNENDKIPLDAIREKSWYPLNTKVNDRYLTEIKKDHVKIINKYCSEYITMLNYELMT